MVGTLHVGIQAA